MAYVVGSVSVEVVPDFRNAQNAITAWFKSQPDALKVPVRPDIDNAAAQRAETQARQVGARVGKAMSDAQASVQVRREIRAMEQIARERTRLLTQQRNEETRARDQAMRAELRASQIEARALVKAHRDAFNAIEKDRIRVELDEQHIIKSGRNAGGLVMRSMRAEIRQNAGLIAAAVGGALMLGGPVVLAAATALFAGVGAAAALQNEEVRASFAGLWQDIKSQSIADSQVLVGSFERVAGAVDQSFQRIRPALRDIFAAVGPQIEEFTVMALRAGEVALPGLTRAVQANAPVIRGLGLGLIEIGEGFSDFFDILAQGAPTAGQVFLDFGELVGTALPLLAELGVVGMEAATNVLPAFTTALRGVNGVVDLLGGALPNLLTGFLAFRVIGGIGAQMRDWAASLGVASMQGGAFAGAQNKAAGALSSVGRALPGVGVAVGLIATAMSAGSDQTTEWSRALLEGGQAAATARAEMGDPGFWDGIAFSMSNLFNSKAWSTESTSVLMMRAAREEADEFRASLDPLSSAKLDLTRASNELSMVMADENATAGDLSAAQGDVARATARVAKEQAALEMATKGATEAMAEQAEAARARVDSNFAYQQSIIDLRTAQTDMNDAFSEFGRNSDEGKQALLDFKTALMDVVTAAGDKAFDALPAGLSETAREAFRAKAEIAEMDRLIAEGFVLPPAMQEYYNSLQSIASGADAATLEQGALISALSEVGIVAAAIPDTKAVRVTAMTDEAKSRLEELGFDVTTMEDGSVVVVAETDEAKGNVGELSGLLAALNVQPVKPTIEVNPDPFNVGVNNAQAAMRILNGQRPTPTFDANGDPFTNEYLDAMLDTATLNRQRPTPDFDANPRSFNALFGNAMVDIGVFDRQNPSATLGAVDNASATISRVLAGLNSMRDRTIYITTVYQQRGNATAGQASGRFVVADGGAPTDAPMRNVPTSMGPPQRFAVGGAAVGVGSAREDRIPALVGNGEHVLDGRDVALMGGQAGVYAFREMLNSGRIGGYGQGSMIQDRLQTPSASAGATTVKGFENNGSITFANQEDFFRQVYAAERAALAQVLNA